MCPELVARMGPWESREWDRHHEKAAEGLPSFGDVENEQPVSRDCIADLLVVPAISHDSTVTVRMVSKYFFHKKAIHRLKNPCNMGRQRHAGGVSEELPDRHAEAVPPLVFGSLRMHDFGVGEGD